METSSRQGHSSGGDEPSGSSKYIGVRHNPHSGIHPFFACIDWKGRRHVLGSFSDALSAAKAHDWAARHIGARQRRHFNFGDAVDLGAPPESKGAASLRARVAQLSGMSALERAAEAHYYGAVPQSDRFRARINWQGQYHHLGCFSDALSAAKAHDWAARLINGNHPLNFDPSEGLGAPPTCDGATRLRERVAAAAAQRQLTPALASAAATPAHQQPRPPSSAAAAAAPTRTASAAPAGIEPAAKRRRSSPKPQLPPRATGASPLTERAELASLLRVLLQQHGLRADDLPLDKLSEGALRDICADAVRALEPGCAGSLPASFAHGHSYTALDLSVQLQVSMGLSLLQAA